MAEQAKKTMTGFGNTQASKGRFWKRGSSNSLAPGKPVSHLNVPPTGERKTRRKSSAMSFDEFSQQTDDAWDTEELDDEVGYYTGSASASETTSPVRTPTLQEFSPAGAAETEVLSVRSTEKADEVETSSPRELKSPNLSEQDSLRIQKFEKLINAPKASLDELCKLSWSGIPHSLRHTIWQLLLGYLPVNAERRKNTLERKRKEYWDYVSRYYETRLQPMHEGTFHQITIDIPRMTRYAVFSQPLAQACFQRLLYIWAMRHPATGYVQGMNDLAVPYFFVFLGSHVDPSVMLESIDLSSLDESILSNVEADTYWCLSKLLDGLHDNYTCSQPGIQLKIHKLRELVKRIDAPLYHHLEANSVEFLQFSFRWMNNLLVREMPLQCIIRLWDTYMCERDGFASFHPYVCAAFLAHWSKELLAKADFQDLMLYLQRLPTEAWTEREINEILASAWRWKYSFGDARGHLH